MTLSGATTVNVTTAASGAITFGSAVTASKLATLTVDAAGSESADVTVAGTTLTGSGLTSITINANNGADAALGALNLGTQGSAASTVTIAANVIGASSDVVVGNISVSGAGSLILDLNQQATGNITLGDITLASIDSTGSEHLTVEAISIAAGATVDIGAVSMVSAGSGAQLTVGTITVGRAGVYTAGAVDMMVLQMQIYLS